MEAFNKMKRKKHRSKGRYYISDFNVKHYFINSPLKMVSTVFIDWEGKIIECWKLNKRKSTTFIKDVK